MLTAEQCIEVIKLTAETIGRAPTARDLAKAGIARNTLARCFGGHNAVHER